MSRIVYCIGRIAQLVRALRSHRRGQRFESFYAHHCIEMNLTRTAPLRRIYRSLYSIRLIPVLLFCVSCASYRVVRVVQLTEKESGKSDIFYGVVKNNVLIPEFVLDERNRYPTTKEEAWAKFNARRSKIEPLLKERYRIPNSFLFQTERIMVGIGLVAISPVAIPIHYVSGYGRDEQGRRSFGKTVTNYFDLTLNNVIIDEVGIKNPLTNIS